MLINDFIIAFMTHKDFKVFTKDGSTWVRGISDCPGYIIRVWFNQDCACVDINDGLESHDYYTNQLVNWSIGGTDASRRYDDPNYIIKLFLNKLY